MKQKRPRPGGDVPDSDAGAAKVAESPRPPPANGAPRPGPHHQRHSGGARQHARPPTLEKMQQERRQLPVFAAKARILKAFRENQVTVLVGETGSGKTTQIPQFLDEAGFSWRGVIAITQPRRVAAITVATRVAHEMGVTLGEEVGYCIRFEDVSGPKTRIRYMTDGMLLREAQLDSRLPRYSVLLLDEAHERSLHTDVLLGVVKGLLARRPDLKVAVMSATLDALQFSAYFNGAPVLYVEGRQHSVEVLYVPEPEPDFLDAAFVAALQLHVTEPPGDILAFLPGQEDIEGLAKMLEERARLLPPEALKLEVCMLFAALPWEQQARVFEPAPPGVRKVILATNIAETSITINGVRYVIDPGLSKARGYDPRIGLETLLVQPISRASAKQRAGRAGREAPGKCFRLYTEESYEGLEAATVPEIKRCSLASVALQLKSMGVEPLSFDFMDPPPKEGLVRSLSLLLALGALDARGRLTQPLGKQMSAFPLDPQFAKAILAARDFGVLAEMLTVVAMLSADNVFYRPRERQEQTEAARKRFAHADGDHPTLLNVYAAWGAAKRDADWCRENFINAKAMKKAQDVREQLEALCLSPAIGLDPRAPGASGGDSRALRRCLTSAFFTNAAERSEGGGSTLRTMVSHQEVSVHPASVLFRRRPRCVVYNTLLLTTRHYVRDVSAIEPEWLAELAPAYWKSMRAPEGTPGAALGPAAPAPAPAPVVQAGPKGVKAAAAASKAAAAAAAAAAASGGPAKRARPGSHTYTVIS